MSLITCSKSECLDKIMHDYSEKVASYDDYNMWATKKYRSLVKFLNNRNNTEIVTSAMNFVTCLSLVSIADRKLKREKDQDDVLKGNRFFVEKSLIEEFDPRNKEREIMKNKFRELNNRRREKNAL